MPHKRITTGLYIIHNRINGKVYAGSSVQIPKRFATHRRQLRSGQHPNAHLQSAWNKYGPDAFRFVPILPVDHSDLLRYEEVLLEECRAHRAGCYNKALTATCPMKGRKHSHSARMKMSRAHIGKFHSPERIQAFRDEKNSQRITFTLVSPTGDVVTAIGMKAFCKIHDLTPSAVRQVLAGARKAHKGWSLPDANT